jgi:hypothetical protein
VTAKASQLDTSGPTFNKHDPDAPDYDYDRDDKDFRFEVEQVLRRGMMDIADGSDDGELRDGYGKVCGRYRINHS